MPFIVILGSFRKHFAGIAEKVREFEALGIAVLSPGRGNAVNPGADFVVLDTDGTAEPRAVADLVMAQIDRADAVYFHNPDGYMGPSVSFELGYCVARGKRIYSAAPPADPLLVLYAGQVASPAEIRRDLVQSKPAET